MKYLDGPFWCEGCRQPCKGYRTSEKWWGKNDYTWTHTYKSRCCKAGLLIREPK